MFVSAVAFSSVLLVIVVVTGGSVANRKDFDVSSAPWHVALFVNGVYECAGSIISEWWILSAAHCTVHRESLPLMVRVGTNYHASGGQTYQVEKVLNHAEYVTNGNNDISALKTSKPMVFGATVNKVTLPGKGAAPPTTGTKLLEISWRRRNETDPGLKITRAEIWALDFVKCKQKFKPFHPEESLQLCATANTREACSEDTGGSLVREKVLEGIVSYGDLSCGHAPGVYTRVSAFRDWITRTTGV